MTIPLRNNGKKIRMPLAAESAMPRETDERIVMVSFMESDPFLNLIDA
jgi:hypothetical protein